MSVEKASGQQEQTPTQGAGAVGHRIEDVGAVRDLGPSAVTAGALERAEAHVRSNAGAPANPADGRQLDRVFVDTDGRILEDGAQAINGATQLTGAEATAYREAHGGKQGGKAADKATPKGADKARGTGDDKAVGEGEYAPQAVRQGTAATRRATATPKRTRAK